MLRYWKCHKTKLCKSANASSWARSQLRRLLSSDDFNRQRGVTMSITVTTSAVQSPTPDVTQMRCQTVAVHRRWDWSLWTKTINPCWRSHTDFFVASHWLERSCRFAVTVRIQSSRSQTSPVLNTSDVFFISTFTEGLLRKDSIFIRPPADWPQLPWRHTPRLIVIRGKN